jgi:hypothetical protein
MHRCYNIKDKDYPRYGARGITVCKRWLDFEKFALDMGDKPSPQHSIDRIDNDKGYSKNNCRWVTMKEQTNNTRSNRVLILNGISKNIGEWANEYKISRWLVKERLKRGWPLEKSLTTEPICDSRYITVNGVTKRLFEYSEEYGIEPHNIIKRINRGWTEEQAVMTKLGEKRQ